METLDLKKSFWTGRRVLVTGHTGFKGSWLSIWLQQLGARVHGFALAPPTTPSLFECASVANCIDRHNTGDIRDRRAVLEAVNACDPEVVLHLAAQPLVRESYVSPVDTFEVNVLGTVNILECLRDRRSLLAVVNVTTDKCYQNREWEWGYRESEPLGGKDPYSSSKACAELVTAAYRHSFFDPVSTGIATARAGNVIGGGDWAKDRLIPDFFRAVISGARLDIRNPNSIRPWQHVLEPLAGYLLLAEKLATDSALFADAWNFGPRDEDCIAVSAILDHLCERTPGSRWQLAEGQNPHESKVLKLDSSKARAALGWKPRWSIEEALDQTLIWYQAWRNKENMLQLCRSQIDAYERAQ